MNELSNPNPQRTSTLISSANGVVLFVYAMVAICGYLTYGTEVESNVLRSSPSKYQCTVFYYIVIFVCLVVHYEIPSDLVWLAFFRPFAWLLHFLFSFFQQEMLYLL